jgi:5,10-methenyltetrahydromethanopterin hydrogenase
MNLYAYVGNDPLNFVDPSELLRTPDATVKPTDPETLEIVVTARDCAACTGVLSFLQELAVVDALRDLLANVWNPDGTIETIVVTAEKPDKPTPQSVEAGVEAGTEIVVSAPSSCGLICRIGRALGIGRKGAEGESAVRAVYHIGPKIGSVVGRRARVPDVLTATTLSEVKNLASIHYSSQLRPYVAYSQANGLQFDLYTHLTAPRADLAAGAVTNIRYVPGNVNSCREERV